MNPFVGQIVHYVSHGTPVREDGTQAFTLQCRAAIITEVPTDLPSGVRDPIGLAVLNPTGMYFNRGLQYDKGGETVGDSGCLNADTHGSPFRYCACGWTEASLIGGTWHYQEDCGS